MQTGRQAGRKTNRHTDRQAGGQINGHRGKQTDMQADSKANRHIDRQACRQEGRQKVRRTSENAHRQTDRQAYRQKRRETDVGKSELLNYLVLGFELPNKHTGSPPDIGRGSGWGGGKEGGQGTGGSRKVQSDQDSEDNPGVRRLNLNPLLEIIVDVPLVSPSI